MEVAKKNKEYTVYKKRSGRYGVKDVQGKWVKGEPKVAILAKEGLIKLAAKKAAPAESSEE